MAADVGTVSHLLPPTYKRMISAWLEEDCPSFDYGGFVVGEEIKEARLLGKSPVGLTFLLFPLLLQEVSSSGIYHSSLCRSFSL